ncbi:hypothetical protein F5880DRAFT_1592181 [Lentinula raphanica]|nr:hypothetical protein F5880DRAFT_1592181 [Lentinula raphanica]
MCMIRGFAAAVDVLCCFLHNGTRSTGQRVGFSRTVTRRSTRVHRLLTSRVIRRVCCLFLQYRIHHLDLTPQPEWIVQFSFCSSFDLSKPNCEFSVLHTNAQGLVPSLWAFVASNSSCSRSLHQRRVLSFEIMRWKPGKSKRKRAKGGKRSPKQNFNQNVISESQDMMRRVVHESYA